MSNTPTPESLQKLREDIVFSTSLMDCELTFHSTWGVFSPRAIDEGSRLLLDLITLEADADCLDVGCGYGALGVALAAAAPAGKTHMLDKDYVAVEYAQANAERNGLSNTVSYLSNGFSEVPPEARFDVIVSNLPAKAGKELLYLYCVDARHHLRDGGCFYVVTVNGLRQFIKRIFGDVFGNYSKLKQGRNYTVAMASR